MSRLRRIVIGGTCAALLTGSALAAPNTIWHGLGIPQTWVRTRDAQLNKRGNRPGMERKDPLLRLADPKNLKSDNPAIKAAADIKKQEDLAPQKIKAIKYLATIGCGCYGGVGEALGAALEDCTEEVRYEAAQALYQAINCKCDVCNGTCCTKELAAKMYERAYGTDANGCDIEGSERVRSMLARVLASCPPDMRDVTLPPEDKDIIIDPDPDRRPIPMPMPDRPSGDARRNGLRPVPSTASKAAPVKPQASSRRGWQTSQAAAEETLVARPAVGQPAEEALPQQTFEQNIKWVNQTVQGTVVQNKNDRGFVRIEFAARHKPAVGTQIEVFHNYVLGMEHMGHLTVVGYEGNVAIAGPKAWDQVKVVYGDLVECTIRVPEQKVAAQPVNGGKAAKSPAPSAAPAFEPPPVVVVDVVPAGATEIEATEAETETAPVNLQISDEAPSHDEIAPVIIADPTATLEE